MKKRIDLLGEKFGRLLVIGRLMDSGDKSYRWKCRCECGNILDVRAAHLKNGHTSSCGCLSKEVSEKRHLKHGQNKRGYKTPEYISWIAMKARCYNKNHIQYKYWGGRGVKVCNRWLNSFDNFFTDMGNRPSPSHSLDRYPNINGHYKKINCRWATKKEQNSNTRRNKYYSYKGVTKIIEDWASEFGAFSSNITRELRKGKSVDEVFGRYESKKNKK